jgi:parvulin-like peptidyl-prolyl cis-trans isomerase-like protein/caspase domain-containing protein
MSESRAPGQLVARDVTGGVPRLVVPQGTTRHGLVIGIDKYADERLNLRCAVADARAVRDLMVDVECGCFPSENVQLLVDHEATTSGVFRALARLRKEASENDVIWIYYAGHAAVQDQAYWVTHDADVDDLFATALSNDRITSVIAQLRARRVLLILDCCHAQATALLKNRTRHIATANELFGRFDGYGVITLAASDGRQRSVELSEFGHGAFTYFLVKGLRGEADTDNDGVVTADELWLYLRGKVTEASRRVGNLQTPMLVGTMTHDVALTLNAVAIANKQRLMREIEKLVGIRAHQLTTDEGRFCENILLQGARTNLERSLLESLEELAAGQLTAVQFRRLVQAAYPILYTAGNEARAEQDAVAWTKANAGGDASPDVEATMQADAAADSHIHQEAPAHEASHGETEQQTQPDADADTDAVTVEVAARHEQHQREPQPEQEQVIAVKGSEPALESGANNESGKIREGTGGRLEARYPWHRRRVGLLLIVGTIAIIGGYIFVMYVATTPAGQNARDASAASLRDEKGSAGSASLAPSATPPDDIDSKDILSRREAFPEVQVKHVLLAWSGMALPRGKLDPRAAKRSNAETAALAKDIAAKLKANPDAIDDLVKQYSEDPVSAMGDPYTVKPSSKFVPEFINLSLRLKEKEVGIVKTVFGYHVIERVLPPPSDPLESADVLAREPEARSAFIQQMMIGWKDTMLAKSGSGAPRANDRTKADADKLVKEVMDKARAANADMAKLIKQYSDDPTAQDGSPRVDEVTADMALNELFDRFKKLALRLKVGEVGVVKSALGWHVVKRVPPPPPDPLESAAILRREPQAASAKVKHILLGWTAAHPPDDEKGAKRDRVTLEKLVKDTVAKLIKGAKIEPLMAELSEDPSSAKSGTSYDVTPTAGLIAAFKNLSLRLRVGEVGVVKTDYGIHIIQRIE